MKKIQIIPTGPKTGRLLINDKDIGEIRSDNYGRLNIDTFKQDRQTNLIIRDLFTEIETIRLYGHTRII